MKLLFDNGQQIELEKIQNIGEGDIIIRLGIYTCQKNINTIEEQLSKKLSRKVVVLDPRFGDIYILPPKNTPDVAERGPLGGD